MKWNRRKLDKKIKLKTEFYHLICQMFRHFSYDFFSGLLHNALETMREPLIISIFFLSDTSIVHKKG